MYITTFYSFKGGVGRTMALVNVAVDLARRGKRVLVVDFDLEAPGLDTFDLPRPDGQTLGVVDFVRHYIQTRQAPDVRAYLYESPGVGQDGGGLWIMPSGAPQETYSQRLLEIDWMDLYENCDGFLLFEDLKLQWEEYVKLDYVFIDSRTGHTDIGGICTRQLPDAVVVLFFPNEQNRRGLTKVVRDIRAEGTGPRKKAIDLHFVMSNVPDIDDEDEILAKILESFKEDLELDEEPMVVYRYQSLSLLNQSIFAINRPKSRLALEYRKLAETIRLNNVRDRDSALRQIRPLHGKFSYSDLDLDENLNDLLKKIKENHYDDGEVLCELGLAYGSLGDPIEAMNLFDRSIALDYSSPELFVWRMKLWLSIHDDHDKAAQDAQMALGFSEISAYQFFEAFETLKIYSPEHLRKVPDCPSLKSMSLDNQIRAAKDLNENVNHAKVSRDILLPISSTLGITPRQQAVARKALIRASMALGKFSEAIHLVHTRMSEESELSIGDAFVIAMANWGITDSVTPELFEQVLKHDFYPSPFEDNPHPELFQRQAICYWAIGQTDKAMDLAKGIWNMWKESSSFRFSYWRYLNVSGIQFRQDIEDLLALIDGNEDIRPRFMLAKDNPLVKFNDDSAVKVV